MVWPFSRKQSDSASTSKDVPDLLNTPIAPPSGPPPDAHEPTLGAKPYNPYDGVVTIDPRSMNRIYYIPDAPDLIFNEDATAKRRSWGDNVAYYTGAGTMLGFALGAAKGSIDALRTRREVGIDSQRLLLNRLLNLGGGMGRRSSMAMGCIGLLFALAESGVGYLGDHYVSFDYPEVMNSALAGAATGALYRSPRGGKAAAITAAVGLAAGAVARPLLDRSAV